MRIRLLAVVLLLGWLLPAATASAAPASPPRPTPVDAAPAFDRELPAQLTAVIDAASTPVAAPAAPDPDRAPSTSWYAEKRCDGKPCGPHADAPTDRIVCPATGGGTYTAGSKQLNGVCPREETLEEQAFHCPPDEWRATDVRVDYAAEADGCGPLVGDWL